MDQIQQLTPLSHRSLPGVQVYPLSSTVNTGEPQEVLVVVEPNGEIPLHSHAVDASMFIVAGSGFVLSEMDLVNNSPVEALKVVRFQAGVDHGFLAGSEGLTFISRNGGIVDKNEEKWDLSFRSM